MRKYYRAILTAIAVISLVALIFYRHEYNRLRFVLEAFSYFGPPGAKILSANCSGLLIVNATESLQTKNYRFDEPTPAWQRIDDDGDDVYVYSAYALDDREIRAIGFARVNGRLNLLTCEIYYENEERPIVGDFSYKTVDSTRSSVDGSGNGIYNAYHFVCIARSEREKRTIAGVSFANEKQMFPDSVVLPVKTFLAGDANESTRNETAVCVAPTASRPIFESDMISFVSFHQALGIRHFVVYDFGIPQRFNGIFRKIARISNSEINISYATVPWNFPISGSGVTNKVVGRIVEADCRYRTFGSVGIVATLTWDEYIVIKYHRSVAKLVRDYVETGFVGDRFALSTTNLCVDEPRPRNDLESKEKPIVLGSGIIDENRPVYLYNTKPENPPALDEVDVKTTPTTSDVILVNRYERHCNRSLNLLPQNDSYVGKFSENIHNSAIHKLYQLYAH